MDGRNCCTLQHDEWCRDLERDRGAMEEHNHDLIIVGAGPAGLCAALYAGRSELDVVMLEAGVPGGQLLLTELVDDYPGLEDVGGFELVEKMSNHAKKFGVEATLGRVEKITRDDDGYFLIDIEGGVRYRAPAVVFTAGGTPKRLEVPGEDKYMGKGCLLYTSPSPRD